MTRSKIENINPPYGVQSEHVNITTRNKDYEDFITFYTYFYDLHWIFINKMEQWITFGDIKMLTRLWPTNSGNKLKEMITEYYMLSHIAWNVVFTRTSQQNLGTAFVPGLRNTRRCLRLSMWMRDIDCQPVSSEVIWNEY